MRLGWVNSGFTKLRVWEQDDFVPWKIFNFCHRNLGRKKGRIKDEGRKAPGGRK